MKEDMIKVLQSQPEHIKMIMYLYRQPDVASKLKNLFFYGSLMDPDIARVVANPSMIPDLVKASIA